MQGEDSERKKLIDASHHGQNVPCTALHLSSSLPKVYLAECSATGSDEIQLRFAITSKYRKIPQKSIIVIKDVQHQP